VSQGRQLSRAARTCHVVPSMTDARPVTATGRRVTLDCDCDSAKRATESPRAWQRCARYLGRSTRRSRAAIPRQGEKQSRLAKRVQPADAPLDNNTCARIIFTVNITLSVDDRIVEAARRVAKEQGTSLNELVRRFIAGLAGQRSSDVLADEIVSLFENQPGDSGGTRITREDAYAGRL
jgi:hypothetical protein